MIFHRKIRARIFQPGNKASFAKLFVPPGGNVFSDAGLEAAVDVVLKDIKRKLPMHEYRAVRTGPASFNFVWVREIAVAIAGVLLLLLVGCARRPAKAGIQYLVPPAALTAPVQLIDCDAGSPPRCKRMKATWRRGAEQIVVTK